MLLVFIFDFALVALILCRAGFLTWCWIAFTEDRKSHPIYRQSGTAHSSAPIHGPEKHYG